MIKNIMKNIRKKAISLFLAITLALISITPNIAYANQYGNESTQQLDVIISEIINEELKEYNYSTPIIKLRSAGLYWGPITIGNLTFKLTNIHYGYAGPKVGSVNHANLHVTKSNGRDVLNYHISKFSSGGKACVYVWDSVSKSPIIDNCFRNFRDSAASIANAVYRTVGPLMENASLIAKIGIVAILLDLLIPMDPIPVLPFSYQQVY